MNQSESLYCPKCKSDSFRKISRKEYACPDCRFSFFFNVAAAGRALLTWRDEILFTVRKYEPGKDLLDLPGGFVDPQESAESSIRREIREEIGLSVGTLSYFCSFPNRYPYKGITYDTLDLFFTAVLDDKPALFPSDEVKAVVWIKRSEINFEKLAFPSLNQALTLFLKKASRDVS